MIGRIIGQRMAARCGVKPQWRGGATIGNDFKEASKVFQNSEASHPEDVIFMKRTLGATVVGGSGVFALSRWWKATHAPPSHEELAALGEIHIGHICGNTREIPPPERFNSVGIDENHPGPPPSIRRSSTKKKNPLERRSTTQTIKAKFFKDA